MQLDVWGGSWDLPSVDPHCLAVMSYCKFANVPIKFEATNNVWKSPNGCLPVLHHNESKKSTVKEIFQHLREQDYGCEFELTISQSADMISFLAMVENKLAPAVNHSIWLDSKMFSEVTRPWYGKAVGFPYSLYYPNSQYNKYKNFIYNSHPNLLQDDVDVKIYNDAKECLKHLSAKLAENEFFFGKQPTALDAIVYGYLALMIRPVQQNSSLTRQLNQLDNLVHFVGRIRHRYFSQESEDVRAKQEESRKETQTDLEEFPNKTRNIILAGFFALSSMVAYALLSGLLSIEIAREDDEDEDERGDEDSQKPLPNI